MPPPSAGGARPPARPLPQGPSRGPPSGRVDRRAVTGAAAAAPLPPPPCPRNPGPCTDAAGGPRRRLSANPAPLTSPWAERENRRGKQRTWRVRGVLEGSWVVL